MMHNMIRRSPSITSSTVADPSTVTVRIESASTSDLNVQDVVTTSSSDNDDDDLQQKQQNSTDRHSYLNSSVSNRRHTTSKNNSNNNNNNNYLYQQRPSRLSTDATNSMRLSQLRPITAVSLPAKSSTSDNEWDLDLAHTLISSNQQRNPSCPTISPVNVRAKSLFTHQPVPTVFTTTSQCLGKELRPQPRRDRDAPRRRSPSVIKQLTLNNPASPTIPIVFLNDDILLGSIRALQNERQLCKLSVDYLIDATNMRPDELARKANVGARLPCQCGHTHSRCTLTLEFDQPYITPSTTTTTTPTAIDYNHLNNSKIRELSRTQLGKLFSAVNGFIAKAQAEEKRILLYGFELTPNSPLAVIAIQYLMSTDDQLLLADATQRIHRLFPLIPLQHQQFPIMEKRFQDYLKQLDRKTFPRNFIVNNNSGDGSSIGNETLLSTHELSWESSESTTTTNSTPVTSWTTIPMPIINDSSDPSDQLFATRSAWNS